MSILNCTQCDRHRVVAGGLEFLAVCLEDLHTTRVVRPVSDPDPRGVRPDERCVKNRRMAPGIGRRP